MIAPLEAQIRANLTALSAAITAMLGRDGPLATSFSPEDVAVLASQSLSALADAAACGEPGPLTSLLARSAHDLVAREGRAPELQRLVSALRRACAGLPALADLASARAFEDLLDTTRLAITDAVLQIADAAAQDLAEREQVIRLQTRVIAELSTPIVPIYEGIVVMPIVGAIDAQRADQLMETLLNGIMSQRADLVIVDITAVPMVDTHVAQHLLRATRAALLLGAHVVLVGIGPEIAQTIVGLQIDLSGLSVESNLQAGIAYALRRRGLGIAPLTRQARVAEVS